MKKVSLHSAIKPGIIPLVIVMLSIAMFTVYASLNTYEVIAQKDSPYINIISPVSLTDNPAYGAMLSQKLDTKYAVGSFGVPKKIKLPETNKHIDLTGPILDGNEWKASQGIGHTFITEDNQQKVFGEAFIYMRVNTRTTKNLGDVYRGDIVNIVTTEGWQLGYKITDIETDAMNLDLMAMQNKSRIVVVLSDDVSGKTKSFVAELSKVGARI